MASPITCHVLNTVNGTPASSLKATLTLLSPIQVKDSLALQPVHSFSAVTNADGRVKDWEPQTGHALTQVLEEFKDGERVPFSIKFEIGPWYEERGVESFWPEVEIKFYVKKGERHYHVPCLVGPWTYTTYRGS